MVTMSTAQGALRAPPSAAAQCRRWLLRHPGVTRLAVVLMLLVVWEITARLFVDPDFLSPPSQVIAGLPAMLETKGVPAALWVTFYELVVAFVLSVALLLGAAWPGLGGLLIAMLMVAVMAAVAACWGSMTAAR